MKSFRAKPSAIVGLLMATANVWCEEKASLRVPHGVGHLAVTTDSHYLAVATPRHKVFIWRMRDFKLQGEFQCDDKRVVGLSFSQDDKSLIVVTRQYGAEPSDPCTVEWHDFLADKMTKTKIVPGFVYALHRDRFAALTVSSRRDRITVYNLQTGQNHVIDLSDAEFEKLAFSSNGSLLATLHWGSGIIRLWDTSSGKLQRRIEAESRTSELFFSADGKSLLTNRGMDLRSWDVETGKLQFQTLTRLTHFFPDGCTTIWVDKGMWVFYSTRTGLEKELARFKYRTSNWETTRVVVTPDQRLIIGACNDGYIRIWDVPKLKQ